MAPAAKSGMAMRSIILKVDPGYNVRNNYFLRVLNSFSTVYFFFTVDICYYYSFKIFCSSEWLQSPSSFFMTNWRLHNYLEDVSNIPWVQWYKLT